LQIDQTLVELALVSIATEIMIAFDLIIMAPTFFEGHFFSIQSDAVETMTWINHSSDLHAGALKGNGHFNVFLAFLIGHLVKARPRFCAI